MIEKKYSKREILEMYFNQVYFGHGAWGVQAAAQTYFSKMLMSLPLGNVALLIGMLKAPDDIYLFNRC
jgi:membrane peptidoglycan carboxypeptidase